MKIQRTSRLTPVHIATGLLLGGFCLSPAYAQANFQGLGVLPGNFVHSRACDVSADGSVVIGNSTGASVNAFRWTSEGIIGYRNMT